MNPPALNTLRHLRDQIAQLGRPGSPARVSLARAVAEAALSATQEGFRTATDPYGKPWAPLKSRTGSPLNDTGRHLRDRFSTSVTPAGFVLRQQTPWATTHQYGATIVPKNAQALRFKVRGKPGRAAGGGRYWHEVAGKRIYVGGAGGARGRLTGFIFAKRVVVPRRQMVPERDTGGVGPRFGRAMNEAADTALRRLLGVR